MQHVKSTRERFETWRVLITCQEVVKMRPVAKKNWVAVQNPHTDISENTHRDSHVHTDTCTYRAKHYHLQANTNLQMPAYTHVADVNKLYVHSNMCVHAHTHTHTRRFECQTTLNSGSLWYASMWKCHKQYEHICTQRAGAVLSHLSFTSPVECL